MFRFKICQAMEVLASSLPKESQKLALEDNSTKVVTQRAAPLTSGCRIEGFVLVNKVSLIICKPKS